MVRHLKPRQTGETTQVQADEQLLPEQVAALIRQSSIRQVRENEESAGLQLTGAQQYAISQGLDADKIVIAWEGGGKRGVSGTLRIDQREDLQEIMAGIYADKIKVVWAYSVSRLFRDKYGVQVGVFMQACAEHHVKVVIKTAKTFDFTNSFDRMIFQFLANVAAQENEDRARLTKEAKRNKALRGEYDGRPLTAGFIVDRDKQSPTYGHCIPYEPHKQVVNRLLKRHRQHGEFNQLANEVEKMLYDALRNVQAHNAQALVSVNEQIANYEQTIKIKQAKLDALGEKFDKPTAEQYNQDILDARANIAALVAKKNEANAEEQDLRDLCTELWNFRNHGKRTNEKLRRFIRLATGAVFIDEYSSHFVRLTVVWCTPFPQVDVCYFYRKKGGKLGWSEEEKRDLARLYAKLTDMNCCSGSPQNPGYALQATRSHRASNARTTSIRQRSPTPPCPWQTGT